MNLAPADVRVPAELLVDTAATGRETVIDHYGPRAIERVWKAQHFPFWMTLDAPLPAG